MCLSRARSRRGLGWLCTVPLSLALTVAACAEHIPPSPAATAPVVPAGSTHDLAERAPAANADAAERRRLQEVLQDERTRHRRALAALRAELGELRRTTAEQRREIRDLERQIEALKAIEQQMNRREQVEGAPP